MRKPYLRIVKVMIPQVPGVPRPRWFLELIDGGRIHDCGNYETEGEAAKAKRDWLQRPYTTQELMIRDIQEGGAA